MIRCPTQTHPLGFNLASLSKIIFVDIERIGVNHVALNLRFNQAPISDIKPIADEILTEFPTESDTDE